MSEISQMMSPMQVMQKNAKNLNNSLLNNSKKVSNDGRSGPYSEAKNPGLAIRLEESIADNKQYGSTMKYNREILTQAIHVFDRLRVIATELNCRISEAQANSTFPNSLRADIPGMQDHITTLLNTKFNGQHVLNGATTNYQPVIDIKTLGSVPNGSGADLRYAYNQTINPLTVNISPESTLFMNASALDSGVQKLVYATRLVQNGTPAGLDEAREILNQGINEIINSRTYVANIHATMGSSIEQNSSLDPEQNQLLQEACFEPMEETLRKTIEERTALKICEFLIFKDLEELRVYSEQISRMMR